VVHIEDEPGTVYAQLVAEGIYLGMELCAVEKNDRRIGFESDGRSLVLAPIVAANVTIERLAERQLVEPESTRSLANLAPGEAARVVRISPACRGLERRRLMDFGIVPGTRVALERRGMSGGVSAYRVRGTIIALRDEQSSLVAVEDEPPANGVRRAG
jgi:DtxR family Mn-dependent transcriptional regulator